MVTRMYLRFVIRKTEYWFRILGLLSLASSAAMAQNAPPAAVIPKYIRCGASIEFPSQNLNFSQRFYWTTSKPETEATAKESCEALRAKALNNINSILKTNGVYPYNEQNPLYCHGSCKPAAKDVEGDVKFCASTYELTSPGKLEISDCERHPDQVPPVPEGGGSYYFFQVKFTGAAGSLTCAFPDKCAPNKEICSQFTSDFGCWGEPEGAACGKAGKCVFYPTYASGGDCKCEIKPAGKTSNINAEINYLDWVSQY